MPFVCISSCSLLFYYLWTSFLSPIPRRKMKFSTNFAAMLSLVGRIKFSLNSYPSLELRDITHVQCTYTNLFTGRISELGLHSLQSYGCVLITSWITLVFYLFSLRTWLNHEHLPKLFVLALLLFSFSEFCAMMSQS